DMWRIIATKARRRLSPSEDSRELVAELSEEAGDRARRPLLERPTMDRTEGARDLIAVLEEFGVDRTSVDRPQIGHAAQLHLPQASRNREIAGRKRPRRPLH